MSHHEVAPGQHEIDFKYAEALKTAENALTFKQVVKSIAHKHDLYGTFMPKPIFGVCGKRDALSSKFFLISPRERISSSMKRMNISSVRQHDNSLQANYNMYGL